MQVLVAPEACHESDVRCLAVRRQFVNVLLEKGLLKVVTELQDTVEDNLFGVSLTVFVISPFAVPATLQQAPWHHFTVTGTHLVAAQLGSLNQGDAFICTGCLLTAVTCCNLPNTWWWGMPMQLDGWGGVCCSTPTTELLCRLQDLEYMRDAIRHVIAPPKSPVKPSPAAAAAPPAPPPAPPKAPPPPPPGEAELGRVHCTSPVTEPGRESTAGRLAPACRACSCLCPTKFYDRCSASAAFLCLP